MQLKLALLALSLLACGRRPGADNGNDLPDVANCEGLQCLVNMSCPDGKKTTLSGTAFAPNGTLPLYNATVFIPTAEVAPFPNGVTCDRCNAAVSGSPLALGLTGPDGKFVLENVPTGTDIPLVIQLGRWRRQIVIPATTDCEDTAVPAQLARLPKNTSEGDIPHMAIASGNADPFECLLLKAGLDAQEIGSPIGSSRIHFYRATDAPGTDLAGFAPRATELYANLTKMLEYDAMLLPCEGSAFDKSHVDGTALPNDPRALLQQYVNVGGRVFATHFSYSWLTFPGSAYNQIATPLGSDGRWPVGQKDDFENTITTDLAVTFPKGADFAEWLIAAGAVSPPYHLQINEGRHDLTGVDPSIARTWATFDFSPVGGGPGVMHMTFNTPIDAPVDPTGERAFCGRVVFSDFHVTAGALNNGDLPFPAACKPGELTDQEKALLFMLFDLTSCVQDELL